MALIACRECGKQISDKALTCPECGRPVIKKNRIRFALFIGFITLAAALLAIVIPLLIFLP